MASSYDMAELQLRGGLRGWTDDFTPFNSPATCRAHGLGDMHRKLGEGADRTLQRNVRRLV